MIKSIFTTFPFFVCLFWCVVLFIDNYSSKNRAKYHLIFFMVVSTFLYFCHCIYYNGQRNLFILYDALYSFSNLAAYPLFYLYVVSLTTPSSQRIKSYWILIPSLLVGVASLFSALMMTNGELSWYIDNVAYSRHASVPFFWGKFHHITDYVRMGVFAVQIIPLVYCGIKKISDYDKEIKNYYSDIDHKTLAPIRRLMVYIVVVSICSFVVNVVGRQTFNASALLIIPSSAFGLLLFSIGYIGSKREFIATDFFAEMASDEKKLPSDEVAKESVSQQRHLSGVILRLISTNKLYQKKDIKVTDIALILNTNRTYIYKAINVDLGISFSDLINHYRVENAKKLLLESPDGNPNMQVVIDESGFPSESSFYRIFKKSTGMTPIQWVECCGRESERK